MKPASLSMEPNLIILIQAQLSHSFVEISFTLDLTFVLL